MPGTMGNVRATTVVRIGLLSVIAVVVGVAAAAARHVIFLKGLIADETAALGKLTPAGLRVQ